MEAFWKAGIQDVYIDGSFCTEKPDPGDVDGYCVEPDLDVYDRIDPYWIDFTPVFVPTAGKSRWRMWADQGVESFIHPAMQATPDEAFPGVLSTRSGGSASRRDPSSQSGER
jgi:hypothetical protein